MLTLLTTRFLTLTKLILGLSDSRIIKLYYLEALSLKKNITTCINNNALRE